MFINLTKGQAVAIAEALGYDGTQVVGGQVNTDTDRVAMVFRDFHIVKKLPYGELQEVNPIEDKWVIGDI